MLTKLKKFVSSEKFGIIFTIVIVSIVFGFILFDDFRSGLIKLKENFGMIVFFGVLFVAGFIGYVLGRGSGHSDGYYKAKEEDRKEWENSQIREDTECLLEELSNDETDISEVKDAVEELVEKTSDMQRFYDSWYSP